MFHFSAPLVTALKGISSLSPVEGAIFIVAAYGNSGHPISQSLFHCTVPLSSVHVVLESNFLSRLLYKTQTPMYINMARLLKEKIVMVALLFILLSHLDEITVVFLLCSPVFR